MTNEELAEAKRAGAEEERERIAEMVDRLQYWEGDTAALAEKIRGMK